MASKSTLRIVNRKIEYSTFTFGDVRCYYYNHAHIKKPTARWKLEGTKRIPRAGHRVARDGGGERERERACLHLACCYLHCNTGHCRMFNNVNFFLGLYLSFCAICDIRRVLHATCNVAGSLCMFR